jgi:ribonuclease-3
LQKINKREKMSDYTQLQKSLGYTFTNHSLLQEALTHRSSKGSKNNERLEFLGDAVLDLIVGEYLFFKYLDSNEGELSKTRASLVNEKAFKTLADELKLGKYIVLSESEERNGGRKKASLLSDVFEAIIGAIYLDGGFEEAKDISIKLIDKVYEKIDLKTILSDYKTVLQEITQAEFGSIPEYRLDGTSGPDHKKEFEVSIYINDKKYGTAKGNSKKTAQQNAAKIAYDILKK